MESKIKSIQHQTKLIDTEEQTGGCQNWEWGTVGEKVKRSKDTNFRQLKQKSHGSLMYMYSTVTVIPTTVSGI